MKKKIEYTHAINIKLSESQFNDLQAIKAKSKISTSKLIRDNIEFLKNYYK